MVCSSLLSLLSHFLLISQHPPKHDKYSETIVHFSASFLTPYGLFAFLFSSFPFLSKLRECKVYNAAAREKRVRFCKHRQRKMERKEGGKNPASLSLREGNDFMLTMLMILRYFIQPEVVLPTIQGLNVGTKSTTR